MAVKGTKILKDITFYNNKWTGYPIINYSVPVRLNYSFRRDLEYLISDLLHLEGNIYTKEVLICDRMLKKIPVKNTLNFFDVYLSYSKVLNRLSKVINILKRNNIF